MYNDTATRRHIFMHDLYSFLLIVKPRMWNFWKFGIFDSCSLTPTPLSPRSLRCFRRKKLRKPQLFLKWDCSKCFLWHMLTVNIISQIIDCMYVTNVYNRHCLQPLEVDFHFRTKIISNLYKTDMTMLRNDDIFI